MKTKRTLLGLLVAAVLLTGLPAMAQAATITISGSTTVAPLATLLAKGYVKSTAGKGTKFKLLQGGSDIGVADVARGRVSIGMSSRIPKPSDPGGLVFNEIAKDALCVATNPSNRVANLTQDQVQSIFSGEVRDWNSVSGSSKSGTINVVTRTAAAGTDDAFNKIFLAPKKTFAGASQKASNGLIQQQVQRDPLAVGYVSLAFKKGVSISNYKGVPCTLRAAKAGQYPGTRPLFFVTRGTPSASVQQFINWIRTNRSALAIAAK
ncbi:MAG: phosphate ABC transporter substrate-binding protein [Solirubrobacterales bacterium]